MPYGLYLDNDLEKLCLLELAVSTNGNIDDIRRISNNPKVENDLEKYKIPLIRVKNLKDKSPIVHSTKAFNINSKFVLSSMLRYFYCDISKVEEYTKIKKSKLHEDIYWNNIDIKNIKKRHLNFTLIRYKKDIEKTADRLQTTQSKILEDMEKFKIQNVKYDSIYDQYYHRVGKRIKKLEISGMPIPINFNEDKSLIYQIFLDFIADNITQPNDYIENKLGIKLNNLNRKLRVLDTNIEELKDQYKSKINTIFIREEEGRDIYIRMSDEDFNKEEQIYELTDVTQRCDLNQNQLRNYVSNNSKMIKNKSAVSKKRSISISNNVYEYLVNKFSDKI